MIKYSLIVILLLSTVPLFAQKSKVDEWKAIVSQGRKDSTTVKAIDSLFSYYSCVLNNDSVYFFAKKMFDLAGILHNDQVKWNVAGRRLAERYFEQGKVDSALQIQFKGLNVFENANDTNRASISYTGIGNAHKEYEDYKKAIRYYLKAFNLAKITQYNYGIFSASGNLGLVYAQNNQIDSALYYANICYEYALNPNSHAGISFAEYSLGFVHHKLGNYQLAKDFFHHALQGIVRLGKISRFNHRFIASIYLGIANSSVKLNQLDSTFIYARLALDASTKIDYLKGIVDSRKLISESYFVQHKLDSAYYYRNLYDLAKDSLFNRNKSSAIESITFEQNQREQEQLVAIQEQQEERNHNLQLAITAIVILSAIILFLLLSRSILVSHRVVEFLSVLVLLVVFEFINLLIHPFLESITHHSPVLMLLGLVAIASLIIPLHHRLEHWTTKILVEKNKAIRLANAKKTIEELEG